jgi:hypothetical protein
MTANYTIQQLCYKWLQCSTFKDSSHIPSTNTIPKFLPHKTSRYKSKYHRIFLGIWNNLCFTRLVFRPTRNIQQCWGTGSSHLFPLFSLCQHDGRSRNCQYMLYRLHSFVAHDTFKLRRHNSTLYAAVHRKCLYIHCHWIRMLRMQKPGKAAERGEDETEEYNSGPYKYLTDVSTPTPIPSTKCPILYPSSNSPPYVQWPKQISAITDTIFHVIWNYEESKRSWNVGE